MADNDLKTKFPIDFTEGGDTTSQAVWKHIQEFVNVYEKMSEQEKIILERTIAALGSVSKKNVGKSAGDVPIYDSNKFIDANVTGTAKMITDVLPLALGGTGVTTALGACNAFGIIAAQGSIPVTYSGVFNFEATGGSYIKLFNGLIIQWGEYDVSRDSVSSTAFSPTVNMPLAFKDMKYQLYCTAMGYNDGSTPSHSIYGYARRRTTSQFLFGFVSTSGAYVGKCLGSWLAIGY